MMFFDELRKARDRRVILETRWPLGDVLPVKRRVMDSVELGMITKHDVEYGEGCLAVFDHEDVRDEGAIPLAEYENVDELLDDGWTVD